MTKVQLHYELLRPLEATDETGMAEVHGFYGILRVAVEPPLDRITVDYDASRLSEKDVERALIRYGLPIRRQPVAAA
jgi:copper chaperone CopZ